MVLRPLGLGGWAGSAGGPLKPKWWDGFGAIFCPTYLPSGKLSHNYGKSPFSMGKSTISMIIFNSYVSHYQRVTTTSDLEDGTMIFFCAATSVDFEIPQKGSSENGVRKSPCGNHRFPC